MTNKHLAYLLATTLLAAPAFAQTSSGPGAAPGSAPGAGAPGTSDTQTRGGSGAVTQERSTGGQPMGQSGTTTAQPRSDDMKPGDAQTTTRDARPGETMTTETSQSRTPGRAGSTAQMSKPLAGPGPNQMMASDVRGTRVYGSNNENVGDISDILIDQDGEVVALVVGVGGFLGIGQKDVAIPFEAFDFVAEGQQVTATRTSPPATTGTTGSGPSSGVSGTTSGGATSERSPAGAPAGSAQKGVLKPERIVLRGMTKADLEAAPEFKRRGDNR